ncbi:hypothetical protein [Mesorhizobium sp. M0968]|uniref:hypothetical protein n=1 Tax=Mesorhizobium sp. M0968 TaxID=2957037 RepID=UPI00333951AC
MSTVIDTRSAWSLGSGETVIEHSSCPKGALKRMVCLFANQANNSLLGQQTSFRANIKQAIFAAIVRSGCRQVADRVEEAGRLSRSLLRAPSAQPNATQRHESWLLRRRIEP